jgi:hypothetical protein
MARSAGFWAGTILLGLGAGAVVATGLYIAKSDPVVYSGDCTVTGATGTFTQPAEQANYAALIAVRAGVFNLPTFGSTVGIATAMQESGLRNLDFGDRDSLGLFQQRPSQGWGTEEEVRDPYYATRKFYNQLATIDGWEDMRVTEAAQAVQRSGFPEHYQKHAGEAQAWAEAFRGDAGLGVVDCDLAPASAAGSAEEVITRIRRDFGEDAYTVDVLTAEDGTLILEVFALTDGSHAIDSMQNWAVAAADSLSLTSVRYAATLWVRSEGLVDPESPTEGGGVLLGLAAAPSAAP